MHRPLPAGCHVTWVKLIAKRLGTRLKWEAHFTVAKESGFAKPTGPHTIALDIGYRRLDDGSLRVASWAGSDGRRGELRLPPELVKALEHKDELQALRDQKFDILRASLVEWKKHVQAPDWFCEDTRTLSNWRSQSRLTRLVLKWRDSRFDGDAGAFTLAEAWRKEDKHHLEWLANETQRAHNRRDDLYRKFAADVRRHYGVCGLEDLDLREHAQADYLSKGIQNQRSIAAISRLRLILSQDMEIVKVPAANTTKRCHRCLHLNHVGTNITYQCSSCGWTGDRDYNAAMNILREVQCLLKGQEPSQQAA